ncbi:MAG: cyclic nucleotide-binding domain-containing protein [Gammaproteobacteria bacterium]|nr:cyclic nucleotide-binding domain-containing protein [Gammaproteobacteria bacterium]
MAVKKKVDPEVLRKIPIFSSMTKAELEGILNCPENGIEEYGSKQTIIREAEIADCMYVVLEGAVEVLLRGADAFVGREVAIATLRPGDFFGEQALSENTTTGRRSATVRALQAATLLKIDKKHVQLGLHRDETAPTPPPEETTLPRLSPQAREVHDMIKGMRLFQSLTPAELASIGAWTEVIKVGPGDFVLKETERADCMYVVLDGTVEIFTLDEDGKIIILATHAKGEYFGEQGLMPGSSGQRSAYARTNGVSRLIRVPKEYFRLVLNRDSAVAQSLLKIGQQQRKQRDQIHKDS